MATNLGVGDFVKLDPAYAKIVVWPERVNAGKTITVPTEPQDDNRVLSSALNESGK